MLRYYLAVNKSIYFVTESKTKNCISFHHQKCTDISCLLNKAKLLCQAKNDRPLMGSQISAIALNLQMLAHAFLKYRGKYFRGLLSCQVLKFFLFVLSLLSLPATFGMIFSFLYSKRNYSV